MSMPPAQPLPADRAWQAELWRRLRAELDLPDPAERVAHRGRRAALGARAQRPARADLGVRPDPARAGPPAGAGRAGRAPRRAPVAAAPLAGALDPDRRTPRVGRRPGRTGRPRADDPTDRLVEHRLLAYLGRDTRELQLGLGAVRPGQRPTSTIRRPPPIGPVSLLRRLQADIAADRARCPRRSGRCSSEADRSIQLHASHGPDRQVEVLREVLVGLLADDPTLEPRDIVVMCPDIETFAPLIAAAFGLDTDETAAEHPGHRLRVRLADRSLRQINPLLALLTTLVGLAESRMEASALLDLCSAAPVARKFGFGVDDLERLHELVGPVRGALGPGHPASRPVRHG